MSLFIYRELLFIMSYEYTYNRYYELFMIASKNKTNCHENRNLVTQAKDVEANSLRAKASANRTSLSVGWTDGRTDSAGQTDDRTNKQTDVPAFLRDNHPAGWFESPSGRAGAGKDRVAETIEAGKEGAKEGGKEGAVATNEGLVGLRFASDIITKPVDKKHMSSFERDSVSL
jgi:hypothetical protein